jgi:uncharacterized membrane protein SirB2
VAALGVIEYYEQIRILHVAAALASGGLFALRGVAMWVGSPRGMAAAVRYLSYAIDTLLLGAAVSLATLLQRVPLVDRWITTKIVLVLAYIALGSLALRRAPTLRARRASLIAALLTFAAILWVALHRGATFWAGGAAP